MSLNSSRHLQIALASGAAVFACVTLLHVAGATLGLAYLAPAVFVFVLLWLGHYPGARLLIARSRSTPRRRKAPPCLGRRIVFAYMPRGGNLLATALADRAPPLD